MDIMVVDSMGGGITAAGSMAVVTTVGAFTVVVTAFAAADLYMKVSEVTVASTVVAAFVVTVVSMGAVADFMEAAGFTEAVVDFMAGVGAPRGGTPQFTASNDLN